MQGVLAVSRGLGDIDLKEYIIAEPDVSTHRITSDCEFFILASDGLWDVVRPCPSTSLNPLIEFFLITLDR